MDRIEYLMEWQWRESQKLRPPARRWSRVLSQVFQEDTVPTDEVFIKTSSLMAKITIKEPVNDIESNRTGTEGNQQTT